MSSWKRGRDKGPPFVALHWELLNSQAYKDLPASAAKVLPYFLGKIKGKLIDPQRYLMTFNFSYREANRYGFSNTTHHRDICQLVKKGFIDAVDKGGLRGCGRSYNLFKLSERWRKYSTSDFEEKSWETFQPKLD
jgi:hypothetical protein